MKLIPKYETGKPIIGLLPPKKVTTYDRNDARSYTDNLTNNIQSAVSKERTQGHQIRHGDFYYNSKSGQRTGSAPQGLIPESPEFDVIGLGRMAATSIGKGMVDNTIKKELNPDYYTVPDQPVYSLDKLASDKQQITNFFNSPSYNDRFTSAIKTPGSKLNIYDRFFLQKTTNANIQNSYIKRVPDEVLDAKGADAISNIKGYIEIPQNREISNNTMLHELGHQSSLNGSTLPEPVQEWNRSLLPEPNRSVPQYYSDKLQYTNHMSYLTDPDELRTRAINTMIWSKNNNIPLENVMKMPISQVPNDTANLFGFFDEKSITNYLNKFLMLTGAVGIANKKGEP